MEHSYSVPNGQKMTNFRWVICVLLFWRNGQLYGQAGAFVDMERLYSSRISLDRYELWLYNGNIFACLCYCKPVCRSFY